MDRGAYYLVGFVSGFVGCSVIATVLLKKTLANLEATVAHFHHITQVLLQVFGKAPTERGTAAK